MVIPLSDKDAKDLQRWNNEQEDQRRINTRGSKATRPSAVPGLRDLNKLMRERPFGAGSGQSSASIEKPLMVSRQKDRFGKYQNVPVGMAEGQRNLINSIKFDKYGDVVVNGRYAPELTNTLKSMIKGTLQVPGSGLPTGAIFTEPPQALDTGRRSNLPTGVIGYDAAGRPIMSKGMAPRSTTPFIADGVRVTDSLLRTYITQLEKNSGVTGTAPFSSRQLGPELYNRLFGSAETQTVRDPMKREPTVINVRKLAANAYEGEKFTVKNLPKDAIYVGRAYSKGKYQLQGSPYGNPYRVGPDGQLDEVLNKYETWARNKLTANPKWLDPLVGKDLVDWCEPGKCHADVLKKLVKEKVGEFERAPLTGKTQLSDIEQSRARLKQLQDLKKSVGGGNLSRREAAELSRLQETIRKATTVDPTLTDMPDERVVRLEDKPGKVVSEKTKPETKVSIKNIGDTKAPGIYTDGKYNSQVTYNVIQAIIKAKESAKFQQVLTRQGGIRVGKVFVSVDDMQQLARSIPADTEVVYSKQGNPTIKPRTTGGGTFGIAGKLLGPLSVIAGLGDIARLAKEFTNTNREVPIK